MRGTNGKAPLKAQQVALRFPERQGKQSWGFARLIRPTYALTNVGHPSRTFRFVESHISRKTSEMWATRP
jgi:hypothetical protein